MEKENIVISNRIKMSKSGTTYIPTVFCIDCKKLQINNISDWYFCVKNNISLCSNCRVGRLKR